MTATTVLMFALLAGLTVGPAAAIWRFARRATSGLRHHDVAERYPMLPIVQEATTRLPAGVAMGSQGPPTRRPFVF